MLSLSDRGIYRPGETVELVALVRDDKADAVSGLPIALRLLRPDGIEVEHRHCHQTPPATSSEDIISALRCRAMPASASASRAAPRSEGAADGRSSSGSRISSAAAQGRAHRRRGTDPPRQAFRSRSPLIITTVPPAPVSGTEAEAVIASTTIRSELPDSSSAPSARSSHPTGATSRPLTDETARPAVDCAQGLPDMTRPLAATIRLVF